MTIQAYLDGLRAETPGCRLTAFGDLSTKLVLRTSTDRPCAREVLDALCDSAVQCFSATETETPSDLTGAGYYGRSAILFTASQSVVFARPATTPEDVIFAVVDSARDVDHALSALRRTLGKIGGAPT
ncbi:MAG: hypothetical protein V2I76_04100 [Roseobacter sp.]|nr:hypothetical protein [Roseobacter sp.]